MIFKIFVLIVGIILGLLFIRYPDKIIDDYFCGSWGWAEKMGIGSYSACKLVGVIFIILSFMYTTGALSGILQAFFKPGG